jgi:hypothetical protein
MLSTLEVQSYFYESGLPDVFPIINKYTEAIERLEYKMDLIISNTIIMLGNRKYIAANYEQKPLIDTKTSYFKEKSNHTYTLKALNGIRYALRVYCYRMDSIRYVSNLDGFAEEYPNYKKIIVALSYSYDIQNYATEKSMEIFEMELFWSESRMHYETAPIEIVYTKGATTKDTTTANFCNTPIISHLDPRVKYYGVKHGDLIRIPTDNTYKTKLRFVV